jgi:Fungal chitosanase of glycosyl hydrolase group 75
MGMLKIGCLAGLAVATLTLLAPASGILEQQGVVVQTYQPPQASLTVLGKIAELVIRAKVIDKTQFGKHGATFIGTLPGGELYFEVPTIDVDDDGDTEGSPANWVSHPVHGGKIDSFRQEQTSYGGQLTTRHGHTDGISPFEVPYIVLPGGSAKPLWFAQHGIAMGDGAIVIRGGQCVEAVFADSGPVQKIGEMSIKAHQLFGETVIVDGVKAQLGPDGNPLRDPATQKLLTEPARVTRNSASKGPFVVIVFPGTSVKRSFVSVDASLKAIIDQRFRALAN